MKLKLISFCTIAALLGGAAVGRGDVLAQYAFTTSTDAATAVDPHATASKLTFGPSVIVPKNVDKAFYKSLPVLPLARKDDTAAQAYVEIKLTAAKGFKLNVQSFTFDAAKGGATDPRSYEVHTSVGGLPISTDADHAGTALASGNLTAQRPASGDDGAMQTVTVDLSSPAYSKLESLTIRIYFNTPGVNQNIDFDNLTLNGSAVAAP